MTKPVTLCVPPRRGELCAPVRFELVADSTVLQLTARHRVTGVAVDPRTNGVLVFVDITDPRTARPVEVRIDLVAPGADLGPRSQLLGEVKRDGVKYAIYGTYLGVVSGEN